MYQLSLSTDAFNPAGYPPYREEADRMHNLVERYVATTGNLVGAVEKTDGAELRPHKNVRMRGGNLFTLNIRLHSGNIAATQWTQKRIWQRPKMQLGSKNRTRLCDSGALASKGKYLAANTISDSEESVPVK
jgi:hypothetical protein